MKRFALLLTAALFTLTACDPQVSMPTEPALKEAPELKLRAEPYSRPGLSLKRSGQTGKPSKDAPSVSAYFARVNEDLAASGLHIALHRAEFVTARGARQAGQTVFANDRMLRLNTRWAPGDERRAPGLSGNTLTYLVYEPLSRADNGTIDAEPAIDASFDTWEKATRCSVLPLRKRPDEGTFPSAVLAGGAPFVADIVELGFLPGALFNAVLGAGASESVLGVTFTFLFVDEEGNPTDVNGDGYHDTALKEVWYNDAFNWTTDADAASADTIDIETVALHENGHALEQGHFGKIFITNGNGKLHVAPRAVMNALVLGPQRELLGTDSGAHCSLFGSWPNR